MSSQNKSEHVLNIREKQELLKIARQTIIRTVTSQPPVSYVPEFPVFKEKRGAFVTIHKNDQLRGCIGFIQPVKSLLDTIIEMAEAAAVSDPRFTPVQPDEISEIEIEISVLSPLREITDVDNIIIGTHGLYIEQDYNKGLLLPQVATEYNWDTITFLEHTCRKAGLPVNAWKSKNTQIYIFSADVFSEKGMGL
ncbi:AmmeMemoRadiSam system protein A [candidate division KSB1 bacterium]|nr:AmmeMemoRadiSam system protein A [candidate division KSB1 bacterium]